MQNKNVINYAKCKPILDWCSLCEEKLYTFVVVETNA